ncbi:MAG TPA: ABC transporter ATP-binding protein [Polyangia bacterium]
MTATTRGHGLLETSHLSKWYGQVVGVNDLSLSVGPGVTGLLGPNGAGKSTLIKALVGQLRPSMGEARILGQRVWGNRAVLRQVGYCPEHESLYDDLTALEFTTALTRLHGFDQAEATRRAKETLTRLGLEDAMHRRLGEYSKGMRQRAKLAQAMAHDPAVLLLDEPLTGCDPLARHQVIGFIKELGDAGKVVLVSSHVLHEVEAMTSEILLIFKGQILAEGNVYRIREMIDQHPHLVRIDCDKPRALAQALIGEEHVLRVGVEDGAVVLETREPDRCYPAIPRIARGAGIKIRSLTSPDNNLQAVFHYLTEQHQNWQARRWPRAPAPGAAGVVPPGAMPPGAMPPGPPRAAAARPMPPRRS